MASLFTDDVAEGSRAEATSDTSERDAAQALLQLNDKQGNTTPHVPEADSVQSAPVADDIQPSTSKSSESSTASTESGTTSESGTNDSEVLQSPSAAAAAAIADSLVR